MMDITTALREVSEDQQVKAMSGIVTALGIALDAKLSERTQGVIQRILRMVIDERSGIANELLGVRLPSPAVPFSAIPLDAILAASDVSLRGCRVSELSETTVSQSAC